MPKMNGLELTKSVMHMYPMPILVVSSILDVKSSKEVFSLLQVGALDCIQKPTTLANDALGKALIDKIRLLSGVYGMGKMSWQSSIFPSQLPKLHMAASYQIIVLGSSTGGPSVLSTIFKDLPKNFPVPIVCVQHISKGFLEGFAEWLKTQCSLNIKIVKSEEQIQAGYIYLPAEGTHLIVDKDKNLRASYAPPIDGHRPSINVTMETVALHYKRASIGILLTGMGKDGARGLKAISLAGGLTIAQNEDSCAVFGMPQEAISMGAASLIMDPSAIGHVLKMIAP
jgi:two-component system chemotaxis response regulator CheB